MGEARNRAGEAHNPEVGNIAHIDHRLTPALRHGSSLLHQARERSEPFLDRLMAERHPGYMAAAREWQSAVLDNRDRQTRRSRLRRAPPPLGGRTNPRLAQSKPPFGEGFRGVDRERQGLGLHRLGAAPHQEIDLTLCNLCVLNTTITIKIQTLRVEPFDDGGTSLDQETMEKLFGCSGRVDGAAIVLAGTRKSSFVRRRLTPRERSRE